MITNQWEFVERYLTIGWAEHSTGWEEKNGHPNILQYDWGFISFLTHYRIPQIIVFDHFFTKDFTPS